MTNFQEMPKNLHLDGKNVERGPQLAAHMPFPPPPKSQDWLLDTRSRYQTLLIVKQKIVYNTGDARKLIARNTPTTFRNLSRTEMGSTKSLECGSTQLYLIQVIISFGYRNHSIVSLNFVSHCCEHAYLNKWNALANV